MNVRIHPKWHQALAAEFDKPYFAELAGFVRAEYAATTIYPPAGRIFAAFDACPPDDVRVVILGQDPYHGPGQANGLCFSVNDGTALPPSLVNIYKEIEDETGRPCPTSGDLGRWASQGVLLLNATLTVRAGQPASHAGHGWEQFTDAAIAAVSALNTGAVFMLWGNYARRKAALIDASRHLVLTSAHPSPLSAYRGFFGNGHFTAANRWLTAHGKEAVQW